MKIVVSDSKGKIELGRKYGKKFFILPAHNEVILIPLMKDLIKDLKELSKG